MAMASYTMARLTKVGSKNVLKVMVIALFASIITTHLTEISLLGIFGRSRFPSPVIKAIAINLDRWGNFWAKPTGVPMTNVIPWVVIGLIFMVIIRYLCSRILWSPDPPATIPAWSWNVSLHGV